METLSQTTAQTQHEPTREMEKLPLTPPIMKPGSLLKDTGQGDKTDEYDAWKTKRAE